MGSEIQKSDIEALKAQIDAEIATRPQIRSSIQKIDVEALKAQVDEEIAARLRIEADSALYIHRRGFQVGDLRLLVSMEATSEIVEMPPVYPLPGAPAGVKGLANRHGRVVPVVDILAIFGLPHEYAAKMWLLVYGYGDEAVGFVVDGLPERKKFAQEDEVNLQDVTHPIVPYSRAAYREGQDIWLDLDAEAFFAYVFKVEQSTV